MSDGRSLEKVGVTPDEIVLPTGQDLASNLDPVLSYAAKTVGIDITLRRRDILPDRVAEVTEKCSFRLTLSA